VQHELRDAVGIFEHRFVGVGRTDAGHDTFTHTGNDGFLRGTTHEAIKVRADSHTGTHTQRDAVFGHGVDLAAPAHVRMRAIDDLGIDAGAHGFEDSLACAFAGEVDGASAIVVERDAGLVSGDEGQHDMRDLATCQEVRLKLVGVDRDARFGGGDARIDDHGIRHATQPHGEECGETDRRVRDPGTQPEIEEFGNDQEQNERDDDHDAGDEDFKGGHGYGFVG
jgi:hypothetical protein